MELSHILIATDANSRRTHFSGYLKRRRVYHGFWRESLRILAKRTRMMPATRRRVVAGDGVDCYFKNVCSEFIEAALKLEAGEYSVPVKTQFGYHLIKVNERKKAQGEEWEAEKEKISNELYAQKFQMEKRQEWMRNLRENEAQVEILDPVLLGYNLAGKDKWAEAAQAYEKALTDKRYKNKLNTYLALADAYKEAKNFGAALDVFARLPKELANDFKVPLVKAEIYAAQDQKEAAKAALLEAQAKAGDELQLLRLVLDKMRELELTTEADALQEKVDTLEAKLRAEQEELARIIQEEQERINTPQLDL